jgi:hypothetical protein
VVVGPGLDIAGLDVAGLDDARLNDVELDEVGIVLGDEDPALLLVSDVTLVVNPEAC